MRDTGRIKCYRAEWALGEQEQLPWPDLVALAATVLSDERVRHAYPHLIGIKLRPVMDYRRGFIGQYDPKSHRIKLPWGGRSALVLMHELAHAATPGHGHTDQWREAYVFLVWRFLGEDAGRRLVASFANHGAIKHGRK